MKTSAKKKLRRERRKKKSLRPPEWDPELPRDKAGIEDAMNRILRERTHELVSPQDPTFMPDGSKIVKMGPALNELMRLQRQLFRATFNREPDPKDPVFWDHDRELEGPKPINADKYRREIGKHALAAGIRPQVAYAMRKTGMIIAESNKHLFTESQLDEWDDAVEEYYALQ